MAAGHAVTARRGTTGAVEARTYSGGAVYSPRNPPPFRAGRMSSSSVVPQRYSCLFSNQPKRLHVTGQPRAPGRGVVAWKLFVFLTHREKDAAISRVMEAKEVVRMDKRYQFLNEPYSDVPHYTTDQTLVGSMLNYILSRSFCVDLELSTSGAHVMRVRDANNGVALHYHDLQVLIGAAVLFTAGELVYE